MTLHFIHLVNSWSRDGNHDFTTCELNALFSEIVNFVIMTSSLFMFALDNIRYKGDTDYGFIVLLLYDKILSNPIKILKIGRFIARYSHSLSSTAAIFNHEVENSSCTNPTPVHRLWSRVHEVTRSMERYFTARVHELNGTQHELHGCGPAVA